MEFIEQQGNTLRIPLDKRPADEATEDILSKIEPVIARQLGFFLRGHRDDKVSFNVDFLDIESRTDCTTIRAVVSASATRESSNQSGVPRWFAFTFVRPGTDAYQPLSLFSVDHCDGYGNGVSFREHNPTRLQPAELPAEAVSTVFIKIASCVLRCLEDWSDGADEGEVTQWLRESRPGITAHVMTVQCGGMDFEVECVRSWGALPRVVNVTRIN